MIGLKASAHGAGESIREDRVFWLVGMAAPESWSGSRLRREAGRGLIARVCGVHCALGVLVGELKSRRSWCIFSSVIDFVLHMEMDSVKGLEDTNKNHLIAMHSLHENFQKIKETKKGRASIGRCGAFSRETVRTSIPYSYNDFYRKLCTLSSCNKPLV